MQVSWQQSYSTRSSVQDVRLRSMVCDIDRDCKARLPAWSRHVHGIMQYKMASNIPGGWTRSRAPKIADSAAFWISRADN